MLCWNIRGFRTGKGLILDYINGEAPDVVLLQESMHRTPPKIPGYLVYHIPALVGGTSKGLITAVKPTVPHQPPKLHINPGIEVISLPITMVDGGTLNLTNLYVHPGTRPDLQPFQTGQHYLITGDLNANVDRWGTATTRAGRAVAP